MGFNARDTLATFASVCRLHIVTIAALGTLTMGWVLLGQYFWLATAITAFDWFVVNLLNRVVDVEEDQANQIRGTRFVAGRKRLLTLVGFVVLGASLVLTQLHCPELTALRLSFHTLGLAYNWPLLPNRRRIKQLYFFKNVASAVGFLITVFGYPLALSDAVYPDGVTSATVLITAAFFFLFELSYEAIYDLRDARGDALANVRSYAVVHGEYAATVIIDSLLATSFTALVTGFAVGLVPWRIAVMGVAPLLQFVLYKRMYRRGITASDCIHLTWLGAALLAAYHLWILLDLPGVNA